MTREENVELLEIDRLLTRRRFGHALRAAERAVQRYPENRMFRGKVAEAHIHLRNSDLGRALLRPLLGDCPEDAYFHFLLGLSYFLTESYAAALPHAQRSRSVNPQFHLGTLLTADTFIELEQHDEAEGILLEELRSACNSRSSRTSGLYILLAKLADRRSHGDAARRYFLQALRCDPGNPLLLYSLWQRNPPATRRTRMFEVEVVGRAFENPLSDYLGVFHVAADSSGEALEFIREIEFLADPSSLAIEVEREIRATSPAPSHKGVIHAYPGWVIHGVTSSRASLVH